jgi:serine/threonine protein kinase
MATLTECLATEQLQALVAGGLSDVEQEAASAHVDSCPRCQQALETLVAGTESWPRLAGELRGDGGTPVDAALGRAMADLKRRSGVSTFGGASVAGAEFVLYRLAPAESPDHLGRLDHYEVLGVLGRGGMGVVLLAFDPKLHRRVAIKVLAPHLAGSRPARESFLREARTMAAVNHDNILTIHAVEGAGALPYLVMQYVPGGSLQQRLDREGALRLEDILSIGAQAAAGLAAAHARGVVHRDVKPANILLDGRRAKLSDFGLAQAPDEPGRSHHGAITGTPQYMAPEQARGEPVDQRADLFSLGGVLYALCTGRPPFTGETTTEVLRQVREYRPQSIEDLNPEVPERLVRLIDRLMAKDPAERFQSAAHVASLLESWREHPEQLSKPRGGLPAAVVVALVAMVGLLLIVPCIGLLALGGWWFSGATTPNNRAVLDSDPRGDGPPVEERPEGGEKGTRPEPPASVTGRTALRYRWAGGGTFVYQITLRVGLGDKELLTEGSATYTVRPVQPGGRADEETFALDYGAGFARRTVTKTGLAEGWPTWLDPQSGRVQLNSWGEPLESEGTRPAGGLGNLALLPLEPLGRDGRPRWDVRGECELVLREPDTDEDRLPLGPRRLGPRGLPGLPRPPQLSRALGLRDDDRVKETRHAATQRVQFKVASAAGGTAEISKDYELTSLAQVGGRPRFLLSGTGQTSFDQARGVPTACSWRLTQTCTDGGTTVSSPVTLTCRLLTPEEVAKLAQPPAGQPAEGKPGGPGELDQVLAELGDAAEQAGAARRLARLPVQEARRADVSAALEKLLGDASGATRVAALEALAVWGTPGCVARIIELLEDPEAAVMRPSIRPCVSPGWGVAACGSSLGSPPRWPRGWEQAQTNPHSRRKPSARPLRGKEEILIARNTPCDKVSTVGGSVKGRWEIAFIPIAVVVYRR